ncbi:MAG: hypothetical protein ACREMY_00965 [bacterium]
MLIDVIVTAVVAIVLALVFVYLLLSWLFSGWGDHFPQPSTVGIIGVALSVNHGTFTDAD